ncbi:MAG: UDP-N-acetylmuramoyl-tripeptide--D-alanyl-D-alanine ligase [Clostridia bacterium]|nr:UDP-N-acetylmuramoyl-tripeptide--D-alanyl-D-alanine ligase [Clostridia bacterium]
MFVLYAFLISLVFVTADLMFLKVYQLESYRIKNYIKKLKKMQLAFGGKTPLVFTNRIKRLVFCDFLLKFSIFLLFFVLISNFWLKFSIVFAFLILSPIFVIFSFLVALPIENQIKRNFIKRAKSKLAKMPCKTIAITGSFGKTSTKNILYQILSEEFDVCATPKSFNTPMGVCRAILENLKDTDDFFIVEFGARQKGDVAELSKLVGVDFGIITPIGNCHLETFGSLQNVADTKYELCEGAKNLVVFNGKSEASKSLFEKFPKQKYLVATENSFAYAKNVEVTATGSEFSLVLDDKEFDCKTKLLGKSSIDNIVVASAMAYLLGESAYSIKMGIANLKPTPHRLQIIRGALVDVIDDSYNSNLDGFKEALSVLSKFEGRKIVVSPGLVELGAAQYETNKLIGQEIAKIADVFVVMNATNREALSEGASSMNNLYFASTREEQTALLKKIVTKGDVVLFENDLPDNFA